VPPRRLLNISYLIFLMGWFATAILAVYWYRNTRARDPFASPRWRKLGTVLLIGGALLVGNFPRAVYDLSYVAPQYDAQMQSRYATLKRFAATGAREAVIDPLLAIPKTIIPARPKTIGWRQYIWRITSGWRRPRSPSDNEAG